jgi:hypothetical protein
MRLDLRRLPALGTVTGNQWSINDEDTGQGVGTAPVITFSKQVQVYPWHGSSRDPELSGRDVRHGGLARLISKVTDEVAAKITASQSRRLNRM